MVSRIKKSIIIMIIILFGMTTFSFAETIADCDKAVKEGQDYISIDRDSKYGKIITSRDITRIFDNLKSFCCNDYEDNYSKTCSTESGNLQTSYPETPFFYDQILDVFLRRLDAKQNDDNGGDLLYNLQPDDVGLEWREYINGVANSKDGEIPKTIQSKYQEYRTLGESPYSIKFWTGATKYQLNLEEINNMYDEFNLVNRYYYSCEIALAIYFKLGGSMNVGLIDKTIDIEDAYTTCRDMVNNRIDQENSYIKFLLIQKGNTLLEDTVKSYIDSYFVQNKLMDLQNILFQTNNFFFDVYKNTDHLIENCS